MKTMKKIWMFLVIILSVPALCSGALVPSKVTVPEKYRKGVFGEGRVLNLPQGFSVSVFASGLKGARFMETDDSGVIYLSVPSDGVVVALPDEDSDGVADRHITFARGLKRPHGLAFRGKELIVAETGALLALKDDNKDLKADSRRVITEDLPAGGGHWTKSVIIGPDNAFYVSGGSSCNACEESDKRRAAILRFTDNKAEVFAFGLRNSVGLEFHPETGDLWAVDNGRDMLGDDIPPEELNKIVKNGDYGWPYCYGDQAPDPELGSVERCRDTLRPKVKMQAHSAPLGIAFGYKLKFPQRYREALYVAFHGSWNRSVPTGYKIVALPFKGGEAAGEVLDIVTGWRTGEGVWGRPVDALAGRDGALYISDDEAGAIYRITYSGK